MKPLQQEYVHMPSFFGDSLTASLEDRRRARLDKMKARMRAEALRFEKENKKKTIGFFERPEEKKK
tara:strand:+ start:297 stop:494 length:198 start_codon:yes stop_codon:yes gene_type:complete